MALLEDLTEDEAFLYAILSDESGLDLAEFTWKDEGNEDGCWRAWAFQWVWYRNTDKLQIDQCARALSLDTPIPTPDGWTTMGDLVSGDRVLGDDGRPTMVTAVSNIFTDKDTYDVVFSDGEVIRASGDHLWFTYDKRARATRNGPVGRHKQVLPAVRTTREIKESLTLWDENNHSIPVASALDLPERNLPVDPYYLGYWLGDGTSRSSEVTVSDRDLAEFEIHLKAADMELVKRSMPLCHGVRYKKAHNRKTMSVQADLRRVGVLFNKHIPAEYLRASKDQRLALLRGIMDADGHFGANGRCEITQVNEAVARGVFELVLSLGEKPTITEKRTSLNGQDKGPAWRVDWTPISVNPFALARKHDAVKFGSFKATHRRIVDVREVACVPTKCITVDNDSHLFLAGKHMVPTHNSLGKSVSIQLRGFIFPFVHPGQEMLITAPELVHLKPVVQSIEHRILSIRLSREMLDTRNRSTGFQHQPFAAQFTNGARILGRIPQRDGRGIKGMHPLWLELDEGQDYPAPGWTELFETLKFGDDHATWRAHGVTRGVRDTFYELTQNDSGWTVHRFTAQYRPDWSAAEREQKTKMYGGRNSHDYRRNIYGQHGDQTNPLFVLARLMACYRSDENDPVCQNYVYERISDERMKQYQLPIEDFVQVPARHGTYSSVWVGMDVGMTNHPSEVLVFAEVPVQTRGKALSGTELALQLVSRWHMERITAGDQRRLLAKLNFIYKPKAISLDKTGVGLPIYQDMMEMSQELANVTKGYNFSSKIPVGFDDPTDIDNTLIMRNVLEYASDKLREYVDSGWVIFPNDEELIREWQGQGVTTVKSAMNPYGKKEFTKGTFHTLDAGRMAVLGKVQDPIEKILNDPIDGFGGGVMDVFYDGSGTYGY